MTAWTQLELAPANFQATYNITCVPLIAYGVGHVAKSSLTSEGITDSISVHVGPRDRSIPRTIEVFRTVTFALSLYCIQTNKNVSRREQFHPTEEELQSGWIHGLNGTNGQLVNCCPQRSKPRAAKFI